MSPKTSQKFHELDNEGAIFMGAQRNPDGCGIGLYGVPYDGTTSFRPGARFGPSSIREVSSALESYCPQFDTDLDDLAFTDLGSLKVSLGSPEPTIKAVKQVTQKVLAQNLKPLILGGEHSISSGAVSATAEAFQDLVLVQLDAHADLREHWLGSSHSHACAMRRCLEVLPSGDLIQLAIRSGTKEEFQELHDQNRLVSHISGSKALDLAKALTPYKGRPLYLTVDLDWFDPSVLPGTGTPEPGGFQWSDFAEVIEVLRAHNLVAADVVELAPQLDPSGISSVLAAKVTRSLLMLLNEATKNSNQLNSH